MRDFRGWIDETVIKVIKRIKLNLPHVDRIRILQEIVERTRDRTDCIQGMLTPVLQWADKESKKKRRARRRSTTAG